MSRKSTRLCSEPLCGVVLEDALGGSRCAAHRRSPWDRWKSSQTPERLIGYSSAKYRRFRVSILRERGPVCQECGARDQPIELHHLDHRGASGPRAFDPLNVKLVCIPCHRRLRRRRATA
jgi:HNH endonuclease